MPPDLNTLPASPSASGQTHPLRQPAVPLPAGAAAQSPASHHQAHGLPAATTTNTTNTTSTTTDDARRLPARRRSSIRMHLPLSDATVALPGELPASPSLRHRSSLSSPRHERAPSLGDIHQELENEQEAQVNRLLHMIRQQQAQIVALTANSQATGAGHASSSSAVIDDGTPASERSLSISHQTVAPVPLAGSRSRSPYGSLSRNSSYRDRSHANSRTNSPRLRPASSAHGDANDLALGQPAGRDESAFYQAETQMLTRENQMLKNRIRELERQLSELNPRSASPPQAPAPTAEDKGTE